MTVEAPSLSAEELVAHAQAAYVRQDMGEACEDIGNAARKLPDHPAIAFMHAQFAYESWREAVPLFERAAALNPGNRDLVRNFALALISEGQGPRAEALLTGILARNPGWIEGLNVLATLRMTRGDDDPLRGFADSAARMPNDIAILQAWFHKLAAMRDWNAAGRVLDQLERHAPEAVKLSRLYLQCESGQAHNDPAIFDGLDGSRDPGVALMMVRHALRHGEARRALGIVEGQLDNAAQGQFWPYAWLCWRLLDDPMADWLEGEAPLWRSIDLPINPSELAELANFLRDLHQMTAPYPEQSVRGGTQTDRNLLLHHHPVIGNVREIITEAIADWRAELPHAQTRHPFLSAKPEAIRFSGSWSVRLREGGYHAAHTHPRGWASSAFYVTTPAEQDEDHAGDLALGMPPADLKIDLAPRAHVQPKPGRLVLFPSIMWHATVPFAGEERMTIAFDVAPGASYGNI